MPTSTSTPSGSRSGNGSGGRPPPKARNKIPNVLRPASTSPLTAPSSSSSTSSKRPNDNDDDEEPVYNLFALASSLKTQASRSTSSSSSQERRHATPSPLSSHDSARVTNTNQLREERTGRERHQSHGQAHEQERVSELNPEAEEEEEEVLAVARVGGIGGHIYSYRDTNRHASPSWTSSDRSTSNINANTMEHRPSMPSHNVLTSCAFELLQPHPHPSSSPFSTSQPNSNLNPRPLSTPGVQPNSMLGMDVVYASTVSHEMPVNASGGRQWF